MFSILNRAYLPIVDIIKARLSRKDLASVATPPSSSLFLSAPHKYKDLKLISILGASSNTTASASGANEAQRSSAGELREHQPSLAFGRKEGDNFFSTGTQAKQAENHLNFLGGPKDARRIKRGRGNGIFGPRSSAEHRRLACVAPQKLLGDCSNTKQIHNTIYNSIGYKNMRGIRLEIKGRLTKRYRADRSIYSLK